MAEALKLGVVPKAPEPPPNGSPQMPTDDDFITRPLAAASAVADARMASALDPVNASMNQMAAMMATTQRSLAVQQFKDDFDRWGPEIDGLVGQFAPKPEQRTLDNYERIITYVRGRHWNDLATEKAKSMLANGGLGERSGGGNGTLIPTNPNGYQPDKLGALGELANRHGLTPQMVRDFCRANNMTEETWMKAATENKVFTSVSPFEHQMTEAVLGIKRQFAD